MGGPSAPSGESQAKAANDQSQWAAMYNAGAQNPDRIDPRATQTTRQTGWQTVTDPTTGKVTQIPRYTQTNTPSKGEMDIYNRNVQSRQGAGKIGNQMMANAAGMLSTPMTEQGPAWQRYSDPGYRSDIPEFVDRASVEKNIMDSTMRTAIPERDRQMAQNAAMGNYQGGKNQYRADQQWDDQIAEATRQANLQSFGMSNEAMKLRNEGRQTDWTNQNLMVDQSNNLKVAENELARSLRTGTINEMMTMLGYAEPEFLDQPGMASTAVQPYDIAGANQRKYEADKADHDAMISGLFGLGQKALGFGFGLA